MTNQKTKTISYWITTGLLSFGMLSGGITQLLKAQPNIDGFKHLGFPEYLLPILGTWKILAVIAILIPKYVLVKEWAYAGLFFLLSGGVISHMAIGDGIWETLPVFVFMCLTIASWYLRPAVRKIVFLKN